jgi:hypothetical protein
MASLEDWCASCVQVRRHASRLPAAQLARDLLLSSFEATGRLRQVTRTALLPVSRWHTEGACNDTLRACQTVTDLTGLTGFRVAG